MEDKDELIAAFETHVAKKVMCSMCAGTGRMTFGFRAMGQELTPPKCKAPTCEDGWVNR